MKLRYETKKSRNAPTHSRDTLAGKRSAYKLEIWNYEWVAENVINAMASGVLIRTPYLTLFNLLTQDSAHAKCLIIKVRLNTCLNLRTSLVSIQGNKPLKYM
jgi:hypothetical protein